MIDRDKLEAVCADHGVCLDQIERLLGQPVDESTRRAAWELIRSKGLRCKLSPFMAGLRSVFPEAKILNIGGNHRA